MMVLALISELLNKPKDPKRDAALWQGYMKKTSPMSLNQDYARVKPIDELLALTADEHIAAARLCVSPEFVRSWRPREHWKTGRIEPGWEPSAGFVACALAILRSK